MKTKDVILVIIQFILLIVFAMTPVGFASAVYIQTIAFLFTVSGIMLVAFALLHLGNNLTPFPTPRPHGTLIVSGVFKYIRHPIYTGTILCLIGISSYSLSIPRFIITGIICVFFYLKSGYEEKLLNAKYSDYKNYSSQTGRFLPKIFK